jgi:GNAT superfamily N-acetyltransferase
MKLRIKYLVEHVDVIPLLAMWMYQEWGRRTPYASIEHEITQLNLHLNTDRIPLTLLAFFETRVVGTVSIVTYDMDERMELTPWLASMYVAPEARGEGVGEALMAAAEEKATELRIETLYQWTANEAKLGFYEDLGWSALEPTVYREQNVVIMKKDMPVLPDEQLHDTPEG